MLEEGEIEVCHPLPGSPANLGSDSQQKIMATRCETQERVCTPLKMVNASPAEIATKVMASIDKAEKELSPTSPQDGDNGEWEV